MKRIFEGEHVVVLESDGWEYVERTRAREAVAVLATTGDGKMILIEQQRRPVGRRVIDLPAGLVGDVEGSSDPAVTARKELEEETGYTCDEVELLVSGPSSPGITSEIVSLYRARGVRRTGEGGGVGDEKITVHEVPVEAVESWLGRRQAEGLLVDLKVWSGLFFIGEE